MDCEQRTASPANNAIFLPHLKNKVFFICLCLILSIGTSAQSKIEILSTKELSGIKQDGKELQRLIGNVRLKQENAIMDCDSAYLDRGNNSFEAFGRVHINENDSLHLNSKYLLYLGNEKKATVKDEVVLTDGKMTLTTDTLQYDLNTRTAYYVTGGHVVNEANTLDSKIGSYDANSKVFGFKKDVVLVNPDYTLKSDTLLYNSVSKTTWFFGPTTIDSKDGFIYCENGWYNTYSQRARFSRNAYVINEDYYLRADSLHYGGELGIDTAIRNVFLIDSANKLLITGNLGIYNRNTDIAVVTDLPMASVDMDGDSLHIVSDTLRSVSDSLKRKSLYAFHGVRMYKSDMQGICDSLHYSQKDSMIYMEVDPVLWNEDQQMKADTIRIRIVDSKIEQAWFRNSGIVIQQVDLELFNQLKGTDITAWFDLNNKLRRVLVEGNAENVNYQEDDSVTISSMNYVICSRIVILLDSAGELEEVNYYQEPKGTDYPIDKLPTPNERRLDGFIWLDGQRPKSKEGLRR